MNPYAPPAAPIVPTVPETPRLLRPEAHVRGIGLYNVVGSLLLGFTLVQMHGSERFAEGAIMLLNIAAGIALLRLRPVGRTLELASDLGGVLLGLFRIFIFRSGSRGGLFFGVLLSIWILWYLYLGNGSRVLAPEYAEVLRSHPDPKPRIALWAKLVSVLFVLGMLVWSFFSDVPRR